MGKKKYDLPIDFEDQLEEIDQLERSEKRKANVMAIMLWLAAIGVILAGFVYATNQRQAAQYAAQAGPTSGTGYAYSSTGGNQSGTNSSQVGGYTAPGQGAQGQGSNSSGGCCGGGGGAASGGNVQWQNGQTSTTQSQAPNTTPPASGTNPGK